VVANLSSDSWSSEHGGDAHQKALLVNQRLHVRTNRNNSKRNNEGKKKTEKEQKDPRNKKRQKGDQKVKGNKNHHDDKQDKHVKTKTHEIAQGGTQVTC